MEQGSEVSRSIKNLAKLFRDGINKCTIGEVAKFFIYLIDEQHSRSRNSSNISGHINLPSKLLTILNVSPYFALEDPCVEIILFQIVFDFLSVVFLLDLTEPYTDYATRLEMYCRLIIKNND